MLTRGIGKMRTYSMRILFPKKLTENAHSLSIVSGPTFWSGSGLPGGKKRHPPVNSFVRVAASAPVEFRPRMTKLEMVNTLLAIASKYGTDRIIVIDRQFTDASSRL